MQLFHRSLCLALFLQWLFSPAVYSQFPSSNIPIQRNVVTTAVPFLLIAPDARSSSLGDAGAATTPDENSIYWNPAKLAFVPGKTGFSLSYFPWLRSLGLDIKYSSFTARRRIADNQTIGMSVRYFSLGNTTFTTVSGTPISSFNPHEYVADIAYARSCSENFSFGGAVRYIYSNLSGNIVLPGGTATHPGQSIAIDLSAFRQSRISVADKEGWLAYGINISNIGSKISYTNSGEKSFIPVNLRIGVTPAIEFGENDAIMLTVDLNKLMVPTPDIMDSTQEWQKKSVIEGMIGSFSDAPGGSLEELREITISSGIEFRLLKRLAVRSGYFYEHDFKGARKFVSLGGGVRYKFLTFDFSYLFPSEPKHPLKNTYRFTVIIVFETRKK